MTAETVPILLSARTGGSNANTNWGGVISSNQTESLLGSGSSQDLEVRMTSGASILGHRDMSPDWSGH